MLEETTKERLLHEERLQNFYKSFILIVFDSEIRQVQGGMAIDIMVVFAYIKSYISISIVYIYSS